MKLEQSLILIKPDAVQRGIVGEVIHRIERKGLKIAGMKMVRLDETLLKEHYAHIVDEPFFGELSDFMSSDPIVALCVEGLGAVEVVRGLCGVKSTDFGSVRGDFSISPQRNLVHSSDSLESAQKEVPRFFSKEELFSYDKGEWQHVYAVSEMSKQ